MPVSSQHLDVEPDAARDLDGPLGQVAGRSDRPAACWPGRGRASTAPAMRGARVGARPRASGAACPRPPARPARPPEGALSRLYAEKRYEPSTIPSATACATAAVRRRRPTSVSDQRQRGVLSTAARANVGRGRAEHRVTEPLGVADAERHHRGAIDGRVTSMVWPTLPSKPSFREQPRRQTDRPRHRTVESRDRHAALRSARPRGTVRAVVERDRPSVSPVRGRSLAGR